MSTGMPPLKVLMFPPVIACSRNDMRNTYSLGKLFLLQGFTLTDTFVQLSTLYSLQDVPRFCQVFVRRVEDSTQQTIVELRVCYHVVDALRNCQLLAERNVHIHSSTQQLHNLHFEVVTRLHATALFNTWQTYPSFPVVRRYLSAFRSASTILQTKRNPARARPPASA